MAAPSTRPRYLRVKSFPRRFPVPGNLKLLLFTAHLQLPMAHKTVGSQMRRLDIDDASYLYFSLGWKHPATDFPADFKTPTGTREDFLVNRVLLKYIEKASDTRVIFVPWTWRAYKGLLLGFLVWQDGTDLTRLDFNVAQGIIDQDKLSFSFPCHYERLICFSCQTVHETFTLRDIFMYISSKEVQKSKYDKAKSVACPCCGAAFPVKVVRVFHSKKLVATAAL